MVTELRWDDADHRWIVSTNRSDAMRAGREADVSPEGLARTMDLADVEYEVDCRIYATGFEVGSDDLRLAGLELA
jgi:hypothetical protein